MIVAILSETLIMHPIGERKTITRRVWNHGRTKKNEGYDTFNIIIIIKFYDAN